MAYYTPFYQPYYAQNVPMQVNTQPQANVQQNANNGLVWVQGIEAAKAQFVPAGQTALLMDSEGERFYLKSTDASGMPMPLRIFEYRETTQSNAPKALEYVTQDEFNALKKCVEALEGKAAKLTDE